MSFCSAILSRQIQFLFFTKVEEFLKFCTIEMPQ
jgi:hypothetical protein